MKSDGKNRKHGRNGNNDSPPNAGRDPLGKSSGSRNPDERRAADGPHDPPDSESFLAPRGDYRTLLSYQKAEVVFDITFRFAHKFLKRSDRTIDQMIQSARSGKQNLLEGSQAALTSKETELKLTNVGRASLGELLGDYEDYLRTRDHRKWDKDSKEAQYVRRLGRQMPQTYELYREFVETRSPEVIANIARCLIFQATYLVDQQIRRLEKDFLKDGGLRERMTRARQESRKRRPNR